MKNAKKNFNFFAVIAGFDIIDHVGQYATVSRFLTHFESPRAGMLSADHELEGCFWDYIENHKDFDLLNDTSCADIIIEHWKKA